MTRKTSKPTAPYGTRDYHQHQLNEWGALLVNAAKWRADEVKRNDKSPNKIFYLKFCARQWLEHLEALRRIDQREDD